MFFDHNRELNHIPFSLGCHQTFLSYHSANHLMTDSRRNVRWKFRHQGCFKSSAPLDFEDDLTSTVQLTRRTSNSEDHVFLKIPFPSLSLSSSLDNEIGTAPSLWELCLRACYRQVFRNSAKKVEIPELGLHMTERAQHAEFTEDGPKILESIPHSIRESHFETIIKPRNRTTDAAPFFFLGEHLRRGPAGLCANPRCREVMFAHAHVTVVEVDLKGSFLPYLDDEIDREDPDRDLEVVPASVYFCSRSCLTAYHRGHSSASRLAQSLNLPLEVKVIR